MKNWCEHGKHLAIWLPKMRELPWNNCQNFQNVKHIIQVIQILYFKYLIQKTFLYKSIKFYYFELRFKNNEIGIFFSASGLCPKCCFVDITRTNKNIDHKDTGFHSNRRIELYIFANIFLFTLHIRSVLDLIWESQWISSKSHPYEVLEFRLQIIKTLLLLYLFSWFLTHCAPDIFTIKL